MTIPPAHDPSALMRRLEQLDRRMEQALPSVAKSFATTVAQLNDTVTLLATTVARVDAAVTRLDEQNAVYVAPVSLSAPSGISLATQISAPKPAWASRALVNFSVLAYTSGYTGEPISVWVRAASSPISSEAPSLQMVGNFTVPSGVGYVDNNGARGAYITGITSSLWIRPFYTAKSATDSGVTVCSLAVSVTWLI